MSLFTRHEVEFLKGLDVAEKCKLVYHEARNLGFSSQEANRISKCSLPDTIASELGVGIDMNASLPRLTVYTDKFKDVFAYLMFAVGKKKASAISLSASVASLEVKRKGLFFREFLKLDIDLARLQTLMKALGLYDDFVDCVKLLFGYSENDIIGISPKLWDKVPNTMSVEDFIESREDRENYYIDSHDGIDVYKHMKEDEDGWGVTLDLLAIKEKFLTYNMPEGTN